ncbi:MAG TPA: DUF4405 domain-containing protein [Chthoniobacterales bacterium]|jgi:hypothetical protein|nr:DUF4405 domain-containing protein [Chthoniobacterales bacterium]
MKYGWDGRSLRVSTLRPVDTLCSYRANKPLLTITKNTWKRAVDLALYLVFCGMAGTGFLIAYRLPHGAGEVTGITFLGHGLHDWGVVHTWLAYVVIGLLLVHLILNRQWLTKIAASGQLYRLTAGILVGLLIVAGFLLLPTEQRERSAEHAARQSQVNLEQSGSAKPDH